MAPEKMYPFLSSLLSPLWKRHRKTVGLVIAAITATGQARSLAIATTMATWLKTRLLRNHRVDYTEIAARLLSLIARRPDRHLLISVDWTEWHSGMRMLSAAVAIGKRAIPVFNQVFQQAERTPSSVS